MPDKQPNNVFPTPFEPIHPEAAESARLSGVRLLEPVEEATKKLLTVLNASASTGLILRWYKVPDTVFEKSPKSESSREWPKLSRHLCDLRRKIAQTCCTKPDNVLLHRGGGPGLGYYFLAPADCNIGKIVTEADIKDPNRVFELTLESLILNADGPLASHLATAVGPKGRAARLYLLVASHTAAKRQSQYLECLDIDFKMDRHNQLNVDAKIRVFGVPASAAGQHTTVVPSPLAESIARVALIDEVGAWRLDGRKARVIKDVTYVIDDIEKSRWYILNQALGLIESVLKRAGVHYEFMGFTATHLMCHGYLKPEHLGKLERLVVVGPDALLADEAARSRVNAQLNLALGVMPENAEQVVDWRPWSEINPLAPLPKGVPFLFINQAVVPDESDQEAETVDTDVMSCTLDGVPTSPEEAFQRISKIPALIQVADRYTQLKYVNLIAVERPQACFQGIDIEQSLSELVDVKEDRKTGRRQNVASNKLKKALAELVLKQALCRGEMTLAKPMLPARIRAYLSRAAGKGTDRLEMASSIDLEVLPDGKRVRVNAHRMLASNKMAWMREMPLLRKSVPGNQTSLALRDAMFVMELVDETDTDSVCLVVYDGSSIPIPRIIGNAKHRLLHEHLPDLLESLPAGQKTLPKGMEANLQPYCIKAFDQQRDKDRGDHLFIEAKNPVFLRYFVPQPSAPKQSGRFSRPYDLMLYRKSDRQREHPLPITLDHPLVRLYFSMMTQDVVLLNQNSKNTLLRKLAGLALQN